MQNVICFGNLWRGDDGFGIHVFRKLSEACVLPRNARLIEAGVAGLQALPYFEGCRKAILVDGLRSAGKVGSVHRLEPKDISDPDTVFSLHNFGVNHLLKALPIYLGEGAVPMAACQIVPGTRGADLVAMPDERWASTTLPRRWRAGCARRARCGGRAAHRCPSCRDSQRRRGQRRGRAESPLCQCERRRRRPSGRAAWHKR